VKVFVVGSVNADVTLPVTALPAPGATVAAGEPTRGGGGKGANVAVAAARAGGRVRLVAAVGDDPEGDAARAELADEGIEVSGVSVHPGHATGLAMICVDERGENFIVIAAGANDRLTPEAVTAGLTRMRIGDVCVVNFEIPAAAVLAAASAAHDKGARLLLNPSPVGPIDALLGARPMLVLNAGELEQLGAPAGAPGLLTRGCSAVVVTLGAGGAHVTTPDGSEAVAAFTADPVDTTGAGDAFTGALAAALADGAALGTAATRGSAAGALATQGVGARTALPRRAEIDRLAGP